MWNIQTDTSNNLFSDPERRLKEKDRKTASHFIILFALVLYYCEYKFISSGYLKNNENNVFILCII